MQYLFALQVPSPIGILWERKLSSRRGQEFLGYMDEQVPGVEFDKNFSRLVSLYKVSARLSTQTSCVGWGMRLIDATTCKKFVHKLFGSGISQF